MRNFVITLLLFGLLGTFAQAQTGWNWDTQQYYNNGESYAPSTQDYYDSESQVPVYHIDPSVCYEPGWDLSAFFSANSPTTNDELDDSYGGGIALAYFFDRNIGIEVNYAAFGNSQAQHLFHTNAVYRLPIQSCFNGAFAPYAFGGVGFLADGEFDWLVDVGFGLEFRFQSWGCAALFADYTYNFVEKNLDSEQIRAGFRLPF